MQLAGQQTTHQISLYALNFCEGQKVTGSFAVFLCVEIHPLQDPLKESWLAIFREEFGYPLGVLARNSPILKGMEALLCTGSHLCGRVLAVPV